MDHPVNCMGLDHSTETRDETPTFWDETCSQMPRGAGEEQRRVTGVHPHHMKTNRPWRPTDLESCFLHTASISIEDRFPMASRPLWVKVSYHQLNLSMDHYSQFRGSGELIRSDPWPHSVSRLTDSSLSQTMHICLSSSPFSFIYLPNTSVEPMKL